MLPRPSLAKMFRAELKLTKSYTQNNSHMFVRAVKPANAVALKAVM